MVDKDNIEVLYLDDDNIKHLTEIHKKDFNFIKERFTILNYKSIEA